MPFWITSGETADIFEGDLVKITATGEIDPVAAVTGATVLGVFVGCQYVNDAGQTVQNNFYNGDRTQNDMQAMVVVDPFQLYSIPILDGSGAADTLQRTAIGLNYDIDFTNDGSTTTGRSAMGIDTSTAGATTTAQVKLAGLTNDPTTGNPPVGYASTSTTYGYGIVMIDVTTSFWLTVTGI